MSKSLNLIKLVAVFVSLISISHAGITFDPATVLKISDGDTISVTPNTTTSRPMPIAKDNESTVPTKISIRMIGTDTPELHLPSGDGHMAAQLPWGQLATDYINTLIRPGNKVLIQNYGLDRYGRTIGRVFHGKKDVNFEMVKAGWAVPYIICWGDLCNKDFFKNEKVKQYLSACHIAREQGLGIFNPKNPLTELPMLFRLRIQKRQPDKWIGDVTNLKLYDPTYITKVDICNAVFFKNKSDALKLGFKPAKFY